MLDVYKHVKQELYRNFFKNGKLEIYADDNDVDKIINYAFVKVAEKHNILFTTVRSYMTRDIGLRTKDIKKAMIEFALGENNTLETILMNNATHKDSIYNIKNKLYSI